MANFWTSMLGGTANYKSPNDPTFEAYNNRLANFDPGLGAAGKWGKKLMKKFGRGDDVSSYGEFNTVRQQGASNRREIEDSYGAGGNALLAQTGSDQAPLLQRMKEMALDREREREGMALVGASTDLQRQATGTFENARQFRAGQEMQGLGQAAGNQLGYAQYLNRPIQKRGWLNQIGDLAGQAASAYAAGGCWIAMALYGDDDPRVDILRHYIFNVWARESKIGHLFAKTYTRFGETIAKKVKSSRVIRAIARFIFDGLLMKATEGDICESKTW